MLFSVYQQDKLFCLACREELSVKNSVIGVHIKLTKHNTRKEKLKSKKNKEIEIAEALKAQNSVIFPKGESLPDNQQVYRVKVVRNFLSGVALNKIPLFLKKMD